MKAVEFGAGNIGRAFIAPLLFESGFDTTFVDINPQLIDEINRRGQYLIKYVSANGVREILVKNVDAVHFPDSDSLTKKIIEADLITTAVGENQLKFVAEPLAVGLAERFRRRPNELPHIVVIACENVLGNTNKLKQLVLANSSEDGRVLLEHTVSWPNSVVDIIVPNTSEDERKQDPLLVVAEDYSLLAIDTNSLNGLMPEIKGIKLTNRLDIVAHQKLFTFNGPHCTIAYEGYPRGYKYIPEAMADPIIEDLVKGIVAEVNMVITRMHPEVSAEEQEEFGRRTIQRFKNPYLLDEITRVGRDPIRKLQPDNRLVYPAKELMDYGGIPIYHSVGIAAAYQLYNYPKDQQAVELSGMVKGRGLDYTLQQVSGLSPDNDLARMIKTITQYRQL